MIFAVYKPKGISSNGVLNILRRAAGTKKIGHAGTLDPLAEGVLVVGVGKESSRKLACEVAKEKEYAAVIRLGCVSTTDDEEGEKTVQKDFAIPSREHITAVLRHYTGSIVQIPPVYSAVKVRGTEAYKRARAGKHVALSARRVHVYSIILESYIWPDVAIRVVTGPGVYMRSLARDIGKELGTGGYLADLMRTRVGAWDHTTAYPLDEATAKVIEFVRGNSN